MIPSQLRFLLRWRACQERATAVASNFNRAHRAGRRRILDLEASKNYWRPRWFARLCAFGLGLAIVPCSALSTEASSSAVNISGAYTAEVLSLLSGGIRRGAIARGLAEAVIDADLGALGALPATSLRASALLPHGADPSADYLGDLQGVSNITTYNHASLYELWIAGTLADGRIDLKLGRILADSEFATTASGAQFLNSSFGWPASISSNTLNTGPAFSRSALGVSAALHLGPAACWRAGIYDGDTYDDAEGVPARYPTGLHTQLGDGQGTFMLTEVEFATPRRDLVRCGSSILKFGVWAHTADFKDQADPSRSHEGNHGFYAVAEHTLWAEKIFPGSNEPQGLTAFLRVGSSPGDRSLFSKTADAGVSYIGLLPGRDADTCGLGVAWVRLSREARDAERALGTSVISDYEMVVEACYAVTLGERWRFVPDVQWILHPGGSARRDNALVIGLRTRIDF